MQNYLTNFNINLNAINQSRSVESKNAGLASKQDLNRGLADIKTDHSSPAFSLSPQSIRSCASGTDFPSIS